MTDKQPDDLDVKRTGHMMLFIGFLLAIALLTLLFQQQLNFQFNPNQQPRVTVKNGQKEVILQPNRAGHYLVNGEINGHPVTFLVDTGATTVALPGTVADKLGLDYGRRYTSHTAAGNATTYQTQLNRVSIGSISVSHVKGAIIPSMQGDSVLLGMSFLRYLELSQKQGRLTLRVAEE